MAFTTVWAPHFKPHPLSTFDSLTSFDLVPCLFEKSSNLHALPHSYSSWRVPLIFREQYGSGLNCVLATMRLIKPDISWRYACVPGLYNSSRLEDFFQPARGFAFCPPIISSAPPYRLLPGNSLKQTNRIRWHRALPANTPPCLDWSLPLSPCRPVLVLRLTYSLPFLMYVYLLTRTTHNGSSLLRCRRALVFCLITCQMWLLSKLVSTLGLLMCAELSSGPAI